MPPRPGGDPYVRNTPSPGPGQHPGYAGYQSPLTTPHPPATRSSVGSLAGRGSITESYHGAPPHHSSHTHFQPEDGIYGNHEGSYGVHEGNYGNYNYDPNLTNSVFEDSGDGPGQFPEYPGGVTPLPGTLGSVPHSVSHTPLPREAPRAVFDEDDQEPPPINHPANPHLVNRPKS